MYNVPSFKVPEGYKLSEYAIVLCKDIKEGRNVEDAKDKLFRMTYPVMLQQLKKYKNIGPLDELVSDLSIAFMKTLINFNPYKEGASFMNYYARVLHSEIIINNYGKYRCSEKDRNLKRTFEGTMGSLDDVVYDKNDSETGSWHDLIEDTNVEIDGDLMSEDYKNTVHQVIDSVFDRRHKGKHSLKPKMIFTDYIDSIIDDTGAKGVDLADKYDVGKTSISNTIRKYEPRFKEAYKNIFKGEM